MMMMMVMVMVMVMVLVMVMVMMMMMVVMMMMVMVMMMMMMNHQIWTFPTDKAMFSPLQTTAIDQSMCLKNNQCMEC